MVTIRFDLSDLIHRRGKTSGRAFLGFSHAPSPKRTGYCIPKFSWDPAHTRNSNQILHGDQTILEDNDTGPTFLTGMR